MIYNITRTTINIEFSILIKIYDEQLLVKAGNYARRSWFARSQPREIIIGYLPPIPIIVILEKIRELL
jgi:hypothetical protein